jgi:CRP-like cAMP-binding protein
MSLPERDNSRKNTAFLNVATEHGEKFFLPAKKRIYKQGEQGDSLFVVKSGIVFTRYTHEGKSSRRSNERDMSIINGVFEEGNIVGAEIFDSHVYESTAHVAVDADIVEIEKAKLVSVITEDPALFLLFTDALVTQNDAVYNHKEVIEKGSAAFKVDKVQDEFTVNGQIIVTQEVLSERAGVVREEFNRVKNKKTQKHRNALK